MYEPFLGMVQYFAFDFAPRGYATCSGQLMSIAQNTALFSLLGTTYGGNGIQTFALPDLRGRSVAGQGNSWTMGEVFGTTSATLLTVNMPAHTHSAANLPIPAANSSRGGDSNDPNNAYPSQTTSGTMYGSAADNNVFAGAPTVTVNPTGSGVPFSTLNPYLAITACIATQGIFPSRN